jgi:hypothetical protein
MFCGNVAKPTKNKKNKEGRHVGLDFYDLLIEALTAPNAEQNGTFQGFSEPRPALVRKGVVFGQS